MNTYQKTILYVDDDKDDLALFREVVKAKGCDHNIVEAFDGVHALELLHQMNKSGELPCLVVLDINMPRMDGKQTLVAIQKDKELSSIPVVLFSTSTSPLDKTFSEAKHVELVTKPFEFNALYQTIDRLLGYCAV
jgi:CheY-like chemotaxis protein